MPEPQLVAWVFAGLTGVVIAFQLALAAGAPWGVCAMGGRFPGVFPPPMRVAAVVQAALLAAIAGVVLARAGLALPAWQAASAWLIWAVLAFCALAAVLNLITPSRIERMIWAPVTILMLACAVFVATSAAPPAS